MRSGLSHKALLILCLLGALVACGVESEQDPNQPPDSDPQVQVYRGHALRADGTDYAGVTATFPFNGNSDVSDQEGLFEVFSSVVFGDIPLKLQTPEGQSYEVTLSSIPDSAREISFDLAFSAASEPPVVENLNVVKTEEPSDTPTPDETPASDDPTEEPSEPDDGNASPTPTKSAKPTVTPTPDGPTDEEKLIARGKKVASSKCSRCHTMNRGNGMSGSAIKKVLKQPQHKGVTVGGSDFDALIAYFNR
jgi:hypothetical protein